MQTRRQSLFEASCNVIAGFAVAYAAQLAIFPLVGVEANTGQNLKIAAFFTIVSLIRSYILRRIFNRASNS